jgi:hypothetical protein
VVEGLQSEQPKILVHSLGTCLDIADDDPQQLSGVGSRWSAGLPFWRRKVLGSVGKPMSNTCAKISDAGQSGICGPGFCKCLAAKKIKVSACICFSCRLRPYTSAKHQKNNDCYHYAQYCLLRCNGSMFTFRVAANPEKAHTRDDLYR